MPEPTTATSATLLVASAVVPPITAYGVSLGLRPDIMLAGFFGCLFAIAAFDAVPGDTDTWRKLVRTSAFRMFYACVVAFLAGYFTPFLMWLMNIPEPCALGLACLIGGAPKWAFKRLLARDVPPPQVGGAP